MDAVKQRKTHTVEEIQAVFNDMAQGMTMIQACKNHCIPLSTYVGYKYAHKVIGKGAGSLPYLTSAQEVPLVQWCNDLAQRGFPLRSKIMRKVAGSIVQDDLRRHRYKDRLPSEGWIHTFVRKHKVVLQKRTRKAGLSVDLDDGAEALRLSICGDVKSDIPQSQWRLYSQLLFSDENKTSEEEPQDESSLWVSFTNLLSSTIFKNVQATPPLTYEHLVPTVPINKRQITDTESCALTKQKKATSNPTKTKTSGASMSTPSTPPASDSEDPLMEENLNDARGDYFTESAEMAASTHATEEELFVESVAKQLVAVLSKSDRKKKNKLKIKILELMDAIDSSEEEM